MRFTTIREGWSINRINLIKAQKSGKSFPCRKKSLRLSQNSETALYLFGCLMEKFVSCRTEPVTLAKNTVTKKK